MKKDKIKVEYSEDELSEHFVSKKDKPKINNKMKLDELQKIALSKKITITILVNGKEKNKTKDQLVNELINL